METSSENLVWPKIANGSLMLKSWCSHNQFLFWKIMQRFVWLILIKIENTIFYFICTSWYILSIFTTFTWCTCTYNSEIKEKVRSSFKIIYTDLSTVAASISFGSDCVVFVIKHMCNDKYIRALLRKLSKLKSGETWKTVQSGDDPPPAPTLIQFG